MKKMKNCKFCGASIEKSAKICPQCGSKLPKPFYKKWWFWVIIVLAIIIFTPTEDTNSDGNTPTSSLENENNANLTDAETSWLDYYAKNNIEVVKVPADILYEYGVAYAGKVVCTSIKIDENSTDMLKATTENNETMAFSIVAQFEDKNEISNYEENETVVITGQVDEDFSGILGTEKSVNMKDCHIVSNSDNLNILAEEIEKTREEQKKYAEGTLESITAEEKEQKEVNEQEYKNSCETVAYKDIERNPSQYEGKDIKVSGKVVQVSEGWFDSVTLRVADNGNDWYVTYMRKSDTESRILENDYVTLYGECKGVETYTTVMGSSNTIPAIHAEYVVIN